MGCNIPVFYGVMTVCVLFLWGRYWYYLSKGKQEIKLLSEFDSFLTQFYNHYSLYGEVEESFRYTLDLAKDKTFLCLDQIYQILLDDDEDKIRFYKWSGALSCYRTFLQLCYLMNHYGGGEKKTELAFLRGITVLKRQINQEVSKRKRIEYVFTGVITMILLPVMFLYFIERWGIWSLEELSDYYKGFYGRISAILIFFMTIVCYEIGLLLRDDIKTCNNASTVILKVLSNSFISNQLEQILYRFPCYVYRTEQNLRKSMVRWNMTVHCVQKIVYGLVAFLVLIVYWHPFGAEGGTHIMSMWSIILIITFLFFCYPDYRLKLLSFKNMGEREHEVIRFLSIYHILSKSKSVDIETVLEQFELGSILFSASIQECLDMYPYEFEQAVERLKQMESEEMFDKMLDAILLSERIGLEKTYEPFYQEQMDYLERKKQEAEMKVENRGALVKCMAFLPLVLTIGLFLVVPFVMESLVQLRGFMEQMGSLS